MPKNKRNLHFQYFSYNPNFSGSDDYVWFTQNTNWSTYDKVVVVDGGGVKADCLTRDLGQPHMIKNIRSLKR